MHLYKKIALSVAFAVAAFCSAPSIAQQSNAAARPAKIAGQPNINGIWQAMNTANWNLEAHSAQKLDQFWALGALAAIPAGRSVIDGDGRAQSDLLVEVHAESPELVLRVEQRMISERPCGVISSCLTEERTR